MKPQAGCPHGRFSGQYQRFIPDGEQPAVFLQRGWKQFPDLSFQGHQDSGPAQEAGSVASNQQFVNAQGFAHG